jgi:hypothetical protein
LPCGCTGPKISENVSWHSFWPRMDCSGIEAYRIRHPN